MGQEGQSGGDALLFGGNGNGVFLLSGLVPGFVELGYLGVTGDISQ